MQSNGWLSVECYKHWSLEYYIQILADDALAFLVYHLKSKEKLALTGNSLIRTNHFITRQLYAMSKIFLKHAIFSCDKQSNLF